MFSKRHVKHGKIFIGLILVTMVLMRLIWMDLREYSISLDPKAAFLLSGASEILDCSIEDDSILFPQQKIPLKHLPDWADSILYQYFLGLSCDGGVLNTASYVRMNQGLLIICVILCVIITRFFARDWILSLSTAAILLSRGRLITANGDISGQSLVMTLLTLWFCVLCHWLRSGSTLTMLLSICLPMVITTVDFSMGLLCLVLLMASFSLYLLRKALAYPLFGRLRKDLAKSRKDAAAWSPPVTKSYGNFWDKVRTVLGWGETIHWAYRPLIQRYQTGALFRSLNVPFLLWIQHKKLWRRLLVALFLVSATQLAFLTYYSVFQIDISIVGSHANFKEWLQTLLIPVDLDIAASLSILTLCLFFGPVWGVMSFWEAVWILGWTLVLAVSGAFLWDQASYMGASSLGVALKAGEVLLWFEPILITFAIIGVFHLARGADQKARRYRIESM